MFSLIQSDNLAIKSTFVKTLRPSYLGIHDTHSGFIADISLIATGRSSVKSQNCIMGINEARRWWVGLNLLFSVLLDNIPKLPYKFRMKNVKWLIWVSLAMLNIWSEQVVIWLLVPQVKVCRIRSRVPGHQNDIFIQ